MKIVHQGFCILFLFTVLFIQNSHVFAQGLDSDSLLIPKGFPEEIKKSKSSESYSDESFDIDVESLRDSTSGKKNIQEEGLKDNAENKNTGNKTENFTNPFSTEEEQASTIDSGVESGSVSDAPFPITDSVNTNVDYDFESDEGSVDVMMDLSVGVSIPRIEITPDNIQTEGTTNFLFRAGILIPFVKVLFGGLSFQYIQLAFNLSEKDTIYGQNKKIHIKTGREAMSFISMPCKLGMRFNVGSVFPYFYVDIEPMYLIGGYQNSKEVVTTYFADSSIHILVKTEDFDISDKRNALLPFVGGGCGIEINYGYGSFYFDISVQYNPLTIDKKNTFDSVFKRTMCKAFYVPVLLGIRFYL